MNKSYKTVWSDVRQAYVTTNEKTAAHGKKSKAVVALVLTGVLMAAGGSALAAYTEAGEIGKVSTWESDEYKKDWGLGAMNASSAYAMGFHGQKAKLAVMDSGARLTLHPELNGERFHAVHAQGAFGTTGNRYPQGAKPQFDATYDKDEAFSIDGNWIAKVNDTHGTHVSGTVGANRDGNEFHGVSWGADVYVGNTGGTDDSNYGPFADYSFFYQGWKALVDSGAQVINNSWGTNTRIVAKRGLVGLDGYNTETHLRVDTTQQTEYEYFLFQKQYGTAPSFVDAAYDAVKGTDVVQVMTTGNRDMANPYYRALYPYFNPEAEKHWIAVGGVYKTSDKYALTKRFNEAGNAKWWTVMAPSTDIYSSTVVDDGYISSEPDAPLGSAGYKSYGGTSMAAPHVTGAMGVLLSRYTQMNALQVRDVLFTTANHKNADGTNFDGWTAKDGEADSRLGWGLPDLKKGMYGLGQLLGKFDYTMAAGSLDVWSNDISEIALKQRETEDKAWLADYDKNLAADDYVLGEDFEVVGVADDTIDKAKAQQWRKAYFEKRKAAIEAKIASGLYKGSLVKSGEGTLVVTGKNTYSGGTTVEAGELYGFTGSFGTADVVVNGGRFGLINQYNDTLTQKGLIVDPGDALNKANIVVNDGGSLVVNAGQNVAAGTITFAPGSKALVLPLDKAMVSKVMAGEEQIGTVIATKIDGTFVSDQDVFAFVDAKVTVQNNTLTGTIAKKTGVTPAVYAVSANAQSVAAGLMAGDGEFSQSLMLSTKQQARDTLSSLGNDLHVTANALSAVNALELTKTVKDGAARTAQLNDTNARIWASGIGSWSTQERTGTADMDADFAASLIGIEADVTENHTAGVFFGAGKTKFKAQADGKIDSDDLHVGLYGKSRINDFAVNYGLAYTQQDRSAKRSLTLADVTQNSAVKYNADVAQVFGELSYNGLQFANVNVAPYFGLTWMHVKADSLNEKIGQASFGTVFDKQNLVVANVGARVQVPFSMGQAQAKFVADVGMNHFFGDQTSQAAVQFGTAGSAKIEGEKLKDMATVNLGIQAQLGQSTTLGVSYSGAFGSKTQSNGVNATLKYAF